MIKDNMKTWFVAAAVFGVISFTIFGTACTPEEVVKDKVEEVIMPEIEEVKKEVEEIKEEIDEVIPEIKEKLEEGLNKLDFGQAWRCMYNLYGEGHVFDWRDELYTTNMAEELVTVTRIQ